MKMRPGHIHYSFITHSLLSSWSADLLPWQKIEPHFSSWQ
jgi:hypothetical protein